MSYNDELCEYCEKSQGSRLRYVSCCKMHLCNECLHDHGCAKGEQPATDADDDN